MTKFILVRHGLADYSYLGLKDMSFAKREWAFLSEEGIEQAKLIAADPKLWDADILLSSPAPKALQTASIISEEIGLPINGEMGLHDWVSNRVYTNARSYARDYKRIKNDFLKDKENSRDDIESLMSVQKRAILTLESYLIYDKVIAVTHDGVIFSLTGERTPHGGVLEFNCSEEMINSGKVLLKK